MTKEEFMQHGYVPFGYFAPPLSSDEEFPGYLRENVKQAAKRLREKQKADTVNFLFMADIHYSESHNHDLRTARMMHAIGEVHPLCGRIFLGGDFVNDGTKDYKLHQYRRLRVYFTPYGYYPVMGNHDDNSIWDQCIEAECSTNHLTTQELWDEFFDHIPSHGAQLPEKQPSLYYFVDDPAQRVRYVILDMCDVPTTCDEKGKLLYPRQHFYGFSQQQLDWLTNTALILPEAGWDVMVLCHSFRAHETEPFEPILEILDAYVLGATLDACFREGEFRTRVHADFTDCPKPGMVAGFAGHYHKDMIEYTKAGVPLIYTAEVMMYRREDGGPGELLMDAVTLDRQNHKILLTRIGEGEDREVSCR